MKRPILLALFLGLASLVTTKVGWAAPSDQATSINLSSQQLVKVAKANQLRVRYIALFIKGKVQKDVYAYKCPQIIVAPHARVEGTINVFSGPTHLNISPQAHVNAVAFYASNSEHPIKRLVFSKGTGFIAYFRGADPQNYTLYYYSKSAYSEAKNSSSYQNTQSPSPTNDVNAPTESSLPVASSMDGTAELLSVYGSHPSSEPSSSHLRWPQTQFGLWLYGLLGIGLLTFFAPKAAPRISQNLQEQPLSALRQGFLWALGFFITGVGVGFLSSTFLKPLIAPLAAAWMLLVFIAFGVGWLFGAAALMDRLVERFPQYLSTLTTWPRKAAAGITGLLLLNLALHAFGLEMLGFLLMALLAIGGFGSVTQHCRARFLLKAREESPL